MASRIIEFASLFLTALAMVPGMAHVLELPNKLRLSDREYVTAQRLYRGWSLPHAALFGNAVLATLALSVGVEGGAAITFAIVALAFTCGTQVVFWLFTFPVNQKTANWTFLPANWRALRDQWEYSQATSAAFGLVAVLGVILSVLTSA